MHLILSTETKSSIFFLKRKKILILHIFSAEDATPGLILPELIHQKKKKKFNKVFFFHGFNNKPTTATFFELRLFS